MKKLLLGVTLMCMLSLTACNNKVPEARGDLYDVSVKDANESVPFSEHSVKSSYSGNIEVSKKEFKNLSSIVINGNDFTLGTSTVKDVANVFNLNPMYNKDLGCYLLKNAGYNMIMLYTQDNEISKKAKINRITLCNLDKNYNVLAFDYWNVLNTSSPDDVINIFGKATSYADSLNTKNREWNYDNTDMKKRITFQMIWKNDMANQIDISNSDI